MPQQLDVPAIADSTYVVTVNFLDQDGELVTPVSASWRLLNAENEPIEQSPGVFDVEIDDPESTEDIILAPSNLYATPDDTFRVLLVTYSYISTLGTITAKDWVRLSIVSPGPSDVSSN